MWRKLLNRQNSSSTYTEKVAPIGSVVVMFFLYWQSGAALLFAHQSKPSPELPMFNYIIILYPIFAFITIIMAIFCLCKLVPSLCKKYQTFDFVLVIYVGLLLGATLSVIRAHNRAQNTFQMPLISPVQYSSLYIRRIEMLMHNEPNTKRSHSIKYF